MLTVLSSMGLMVSKMAPPRLSKSKKKGPPYGRSPLRSSSLTFRYTDQCGVRYALKESPCLLRSVPSVMTGAAAETDATWAGVLPAGTRPSFRVRLLDPTPFQMDFESVERTFGISRTKTSALYAPALPYTA